ncbi:MAG: M20 family metallopeptidase [Bacteroidota bacterium]
MSLIDLVKQGSLGLFETVRQIRRHLHQHPELSFEEFGTAAYIAGILETEGISFTPGIAGTGITGTITGTLAGNRVLALRGDMDALPIHEANAVPYASLNPGKMHACGHDAHSASLLGTVILLNKLKDHFGGIVKFIFQPGEEKLPGGASLMIKENVLRSPDVEGIFGQHVFPELEAGKVGFRSGMYMASTDELYLTVKGKGGHGAMPHQTIDTIFIAAQIITGLQQIVSRRANPTLPTVLTFGRIEGLGATNVIPGEVKIEGTFRTFDENWRKEAHQLITEQAQGLAKAYGGECVVNIEHGYPALINEPQITENAVNAAREFLGEENVVELPIRMTAEDFAFYSQQIPACFYRLGTRNEARGITYGVHHPNFDIDEEAFKTSVGLMAWLAINELMR